MSRLRLLLVSGASLVGQNVVAALAHRRAEVRLALTGSVAGDPFLFDGDAAYLTPPTAADPDAFLRRLLEVLALEEPDLVVPCRDDDVVALATLRERRPDLAPRLLCGAAAAARTLRDVWSSWLFASARGLPFAASAIASERSLAEFARAYGFPLVAKRRAGFGSQGVFLVCDERELDRAAATEGYVFQEFVGDAEAVLRYRRDVAGGRIPLFHSFEGDKLSLQALVAPDGATAGLCCTRHAMRQGRSDRVTLETAADLAALGERCARAFAAEGWRGPLNVQCLRAPDGRVLVHEINGRFTGATAARRLLGFDEVGLAVARFTGRRLAAGDDEPASAQEVLRTPRSRAVDPAEVAVLRRDGAWRRAAAPDGR